MRHDLPLEIVFYSLESQYDFMNMSSFVVNCSLFCQLDYVSYVLDSNFQHCHNWNSGSYIEILRGLLNNCSEWTVGES